MSKRFDALVIGGGVAGSTAAILLAAAGWSVALVEKRAFPRRKVCGECIAAPNLALLDALGVGDEFRALAGPPLERVGLYAGDHELHADLPRLRGGAPWGRALGRERLDTMLVARAAERRRRRVRRWRTRVHARDESRRRVGNGRGYGAG